MKRILLSIAALLIAISSHTKAESLKVDFGNNDSTTQEGFQSYAASHENASSFTTRQYSIFNTTVSVSVEFAQGASNLTMQCIDRGDGSSYEAQTKTLIRDWVGIDFRTYEQNSASWGASGGTGLDGGDPLIIRIQGLPAGNYTWSSYHHDTNDQTGMFDVEINDAEGIYNIYNKDISCGSDGINTIDGVTKVETAIVSDGQDITIRFDGQLADGIVNQSFFVINGFEISDGKGEVIPASNTPMRRPISPDQPMWLVHIDTWNWPDPQKIIDLIPDDIKPYVIFNISLSISHVNEEGGEFNIVQYGYETAKSWVRTCAENQVWAVIQPSSGGFAHFSDYDLTVYEEFYREYPNFVGFNYCEQFWGYDDFNDWRSSNWTDRIEHFANLLKLSDKYGGYLIVSWCGNQWSPSINPLGMLKRVPSFADACQKYNKNYILCEKYTQQSYQSDMESLCLGAYLSGYSGQYGIRYDDTGWTDASGEHANFTTATGLAPHFEHVMLTGETVIDGPELIWQECFRRLSNGTTSDGYTTRRWGVYPQFTNVSIEIFRKILDGTVRIPTRQEVIDRTKFVIVNDVYSGSGDDIYSTPTTLFEGLYRMDGDGNLRDNKTFFKKTGRYPTIPTVYRLNDTLANSFQYKLNKSSLSSRWPTISSKVNEFNTLFPQEYTGDIYAGRYENGWVTYNPYKVNQTATGSIPFKYNTSEYMEISYSQYSAGVIKEFSDRVTFYLNNYDNSINTGLKQDIIKIYGSTNQPTISWQDRASHQGSSVTTDWTNGAYTITIMHNGALDMTVYCEGDATNRLSEYTEATVTTPAKPLIYYGPRQYEAENFDYKSISRNYTNGVNSGIYYYTGQGFMQFGTSSNASIRDHITAPKSGTYRIDVKYACANNINTVDLYVNGVNIATPGFNQTPSTSDWAIYSHNINLNAGTNTIEFRARSSASSSLYLDNIVIVPAGMGDGIVIQENAKGFTSIDGIVDNTYSGYTADGYLNSDDVNGARAQWQIYFGSAHIKSFTFRYADINSSSANLIVNGITVISNIQFPSTESYDNWDIVTVYTSIDPGASTIILESNTATGLPNIDYFEVTGGGSETLLDTPAMKPIADTYVRDGGYDQSNFGSTAYLDVKTSQDLSFNRSTYLKFDVSNLTDAGSALLILTPYKVDGNTTLSYEVLSDDSWTESGINWTNQPNGPATTFATSSEHIEGQPIEIDITDIAIAEANSDGLLSIRISEQGSASQFIGFVSKESSTVESHPKLEYLLTEAPSIPTNLSAVADSSSDIHLSWDAADNAVSYNILRAANTGGPYSTIIRHVPGTSFTDTDLTDNTSYYYIITAINNIGESESSSEASATTEALPIIESIEDAYVRDGGYANNNFGSETTLSIKNDANNADFSRRTFIKFDVNGLKDAESVILKLTPNQVDGIANLAFELVTDDSWSESAINWNNQPAGSGTVFANISSFVVGQQFEIDVTNIVKYQAANDGIFSMRITQPASNATRIDFNSKEYFDSNSRPILEYILPQANMTPTGLVATGGDSTVTLNWDELPGDNIIGYNVYRSNSSGSAYMLINDVLISEPTFTDNTVTNYTTYYYVVTAVNNKSIESEYSSEVDAMPNDGSVVELFSSGFETGMEGWSDALDENAFGWVRDSNGTMTAYTGPNSGANDSTWYLYMETSPGGANLAGDFAIAESTEIKGYARKLRFYYHMYGADTGELNVDVYDGSWNLSVWSLNGQQQSSSADQYNMAEVDLGNFVGPIKLRFRAVAVGGAQGDIAIDEITVSGKPLYGDFDENNIIEINDLAEFAANWLTQNCDIDLNGDCNINMIEFNEFARYWLDDSLQQ